MKNALRNLGRSIPQGKRGTGHKLSGVLSAIRYHQSNYLIGILKDGRVVKGNIVSAQVGMSYDFTGKWEHHAKWGPQFAFDGYSTSYPRELESVRAYLEENCKWIGPKLSKLIVQAFGAETLNICKTNPGRVADRIPGVTLPRANEVAEMLLENEKSEQMALDLKDMLGGTKISRSAINRIVDKWGAESPQKIRENPYRLVEEIRGIGFPSADEVAKKIGFDHEGAPRIHAGTIHTLKDQAFSGGHTCLPESYLLGEAAKLLLVPSEKIADELEPMVERGLVVRERGIVQLKGHYLDERLIAEKLKLLVRQSVSSQTDQPNIEGLAEDQVDALNKAMKSGVFILTGSAGTGKTFLIKRIIESFPKAKLQLASPTGKASRRMTEQSGWPAKTIHKLLDPKMVKGAFQFRRNKQKPIEADIIVLDECFHYKQPILTEKGWRYIGSLVSSKEKIRVWSRNPATGKLELKPIVRWIKRPAPDKLLRINAGRSNSTRSTRVIRCTPSHKILTPYGFRRAGDLRLGEEVIAKRATFTRQQRSILIGSLLGDGHMSCNNERTSPQASFVQGDDQRKYLEFKHRAFKGLAGKIRRGKSGYTDKAVWSFAIRIVDEAYEIAQEMVVSGRHPSGFRRWTPTNRFLEWIDEQALAIWYLDNGSLSRRRLVSGKSSYYATLHSERFTEQDNHRLADFLKDRFGLVPRVTADSCGHFLLRFRKTETKRLLDLVRPFIPSCMAYKVTGKANYKYEPCDLTDTCVARVRAIDQMPSTKDYPSVYDLEIADHHNYVAGNIIVSNCSMVDTWLMARFLDAVAPGTRLVLVGDFNQLPSIGPGNVLKDMIACGLIPCAELTIIKRQDEGLIVRNAHHIKNGKDIEIDNADGSDFLFIEHDDEQEVHKAILELVCRELPKRQNCDVLRDIQVIAPLRKRTVLSCEALNAAFQDRLNPGSEKAGTAMRVGDKVIQMKNNYELGVINGDIGFVSEIDKKKRKMHVAFDNPERLVEFALWENDLQLAYAVTVHKFQGSEARVIVMPMHKCLGTFLMQRNLLYTAVSRAQDLCVLVGQRAEIPKIIKRNQQQRRHTRLCEMLQ